MRFRYVLPPLALLATALSVHGAVYSSLSEYGKVTNSGPSFRNLSGNRDMEPDDHVKISILGDEALSRQKLTGSEGMLTLNIHSCSGPPLGANAGHAEATGTVYYEEDFVVQSATLAVGTPVTINVRIGAGSSFIASASSPNNLPTQDTASVEGGASIRIDSNQLGEASLSGQFFGDQQGGFPDNRIRRGIFATTISDPSDEQGERRANEFNLTVGGKVGQRFNIALNTSMRTGTNAGPFSVSDADGQISLLWGAEVVGGQAELRSPDDPNFVAPPTSNATEERALFFLPKTDTPEPGSLSLLALGLGLTLRRRRRAA